MDSELILPYVSRWVHIASAMLAVGAPFFIRFALMPAAAKVLDDDTHAKLREAINARWRVAVYILITLFILTGLYNFLVPVRVDGGLVTARWKDFAPEDKRLYHMLFGIKVLAAFGMFFLASALPGRTATFAPIRKNARLWTLVLLLLAAVVLSCASAMRYLPRQAGITVNVNVPGLK
jgi:uncharacterized membrane protein